MTGVFLPGHLLPAHRLFPGFSHAVGCVLSLPVEGRGPACRHLGQEAVMTAAKRSRAAQEYAMVPPSPDPWPKPSTANGSPEGLAPHCNSPLISCGCKEPSMTRQTLCSCRGWGRPGPDSWPGEAHGLSREPGQFLTTPHTSAFSGKHGDRRERPARRGPTGAGNAGSWCTASKGLTAPNHSVLGLDKGEAEWKALLREVSLQDRRHQRTEREHQI